MRATKLLPTSLLLASALACAVSQPPAPPAPVPVRAVAPKVAVVLGGGGARGFAHVGVLRELEKEKIPVDFVVGTSVGSLIGVLYADSGSVLDLEYTALTIEKEDLFDYGALSVLSGGFVKGERLQKFLEKTLKHKTIESMPVKFAAVAVDVRTGETVVFRTGAPAPAVRASCAIPGAFVPVQHQGRTLVDGGVTNPIPADVARSMGAEVVLSVAIPAEVPREAPSNPVTVALQSAAIMAQQIGELRAKESDVVVRPKVGDVAFDDFTQKKRLMDAGVAAAKVAMPDIQAAVKAKTRLVPVE